MTGPSTARPPTGSSGPSGTSTRPPTDSAAIATGLARSLRRAGLDAPASATVSFAEALAVLGPFRASEVFAAGSACFVRGPEDAEVYAATFFSFFGHAVQTFPGGRLTTVPPAVMPRQPPAVNEEPPDTDEEGAAEHDDDGPDDDEPPEAAWSATEVLRHKDFAACTEEELAEATRLMASMRHRVPMRRGRRLVAAGHAPHGIPDVRRTMRSALTTGGDPVRLARRRRGERPRRVVLLLDVSGSMRPYVRALLRFAHASVVAQRRVEAFTLSTRCTRVTRELSWRDPDAALARAARTAPDIEGGTRLGAGLKAFNEGFGLSGLARGAIVVVCSDGWDRGDPDELAAEMERLHRVAERVVWVNPLKASEGYEPLARGMAAALPFVDEFVSGHSVVALEELAEVIGR